MKVKFQPQNVELEIKPNQSVMNLAHENNIPIRSVCNGMPQCAECRVRVVEGDTNVAPPSRKELNLIGTGHYIDQRRLSCQLYCFGDITVDISEQLDKSTEGPVPKKFLARANKGKPEDYHSVGGVLIEQDQDLIKAAEKENSRPHPTENGSARDRGPREGSGREGSKREGSSRRRRRR